MHAQEFPENSRDFRKALGTSVSQQEVPYGYGNSLRPAKFAPGVRKFHEPAETSERLAGDEGGRLVGEGTPAEVAKVKASRTASYLVEAMGRGTKGRSAGEVTAGRA